MKSKGNGRTPALGDRGSKGLGSTLGQRLFLAQRGDDLRRNFLSESQGSVQSWGSEVCYLAAWHRDHGAASPGDSRREDIYAPTAAAVSWSITYGRPSPPSLFLSPHPPSRPCTCPFMRACGDVSLYVSISQYGHICFQLGSESRVGQCVLGDGVKGQVLETRGRERPSLREGVRDHRPHQAISQSSFLWQWTPVGVVGHFPSQGELRLTPQRSEFKSFLALLPAPCSYESVFT